MLLRKLLSWLRPACRPAFLLAGLLLPVVGLGIAGCGDGGSGVGGDPMVGDDDDDDGTGTGDYDDDLDVVCPDLGAPLPPTAPAPPGRGDAAAAYDPGCGIVYMLLGDAAVPVQCREAIQDSFDDLWAFDVAARTWHPLTPGGGPSPRARSVAAWDPVQRRLLVFGGRTPLDDTGQSYRFWNELWAYDPAAGRWSLLAEQDDAAGRDAPVGRSNAGFAIDPARGRLILHGGGQRTSSGGIPFFRAVSDTWAWDLAADDGWTRIGQAGDEAPPARISHAFVVVPEVDRAYAFTGIGDQGFGAFWETWSLDLATDVWSPVDGDAGGRSETLARFKAGIAVDPLDPGRLLLFGGHDNTAVGNNNDLWTFDVATERWQLEEVGDVLGREGDILACEFAGDFTVADLDSPERRSAHVFVPAGDQGVVTFGGATDCGKAQDTWLLDPTTLSWEELVPSPSALALTCPRRGLPDGACIGPDTEMCAD